MECSGKNGEISKKLTSHLFASLAEKAAAKYINPLLRTKSRWVFNTEGRQISLPDC